MKSLLLLCCFLSFILRNIGKPQSEASTKRDGTSSIVRSPRQERNPLSKIDTGHINIRNSKQKKLRLDKEKPEISNPRKNVADLSSERETKRLIHDYLQTINELNNRSHLYRPSLLEYANDTASYLEDMKLIKNISLLTNPNNETRVISFALYGKSPKYNLGAMYNVEMAKVYFPGWKCRFYVTNDVLNLTINVLKDLGSEIEHIPPGMGKMSGMFWRFLVADDPKVDRYIIRDVDSRMNARDR
jgi:hypothetical protein